MDNFKNFADMNNQELNEIMGGGWFWHHVGDPVVSFGKGFLDSI